MQRTTTVNLAIIFTLAISASAIAQPGLDLGIGVTTAALDPGPAYDTDVNDDGQTDIFDLDELNVAVKGNTSVLTVDGNAHLDINSDGFINRADLDLMLPQVVHFDQFVTPSQNQLPVPVFDPTSVDDDAVSILARPEDCIGLGVRYGNIDTDCRVNGTFVPPFLGAGIVPSTDPGVTQAPDPGFLHTSDWQIWLSNFGSTSGKWSDGDMNQDGVTDASDLTIILDATDELSPDQREKLFKRYKDGGA